MTDTVLTFRQYVDSARQALVAKYELPLAEIARESPDSQYTQEWRDYVVRAFNAGATIPTRMWRTLDEGLHYRVLRSTRALRDNELTRELMRKAPPRASNGSATIADTETARERAE